MDGWLIALLVFLAYGAVVLILGQTGVLGRLNVQTLGPLLVWRTGRGRALLERLARPKFLWKAFAEASLYLVFLSMIGMVVLLLWIATLATRVPVNAVDITHLIGLPAVNPLIPLWYGILGLAVAIVVHEGCHGILARAEGISVRSVGLLLIVFPIGAFVEPDENEMKAAPIRRRLRVFAVGPSSNLILAAVCALLFSSVLVGSLHVVDDGVLVVGLVADGPAQKAGVLPLSLIDVVQKEGNATFVDLHSSADFSAFMRTTKPGDNLTLYLMRESGRYTAVARLAAYPNETLADHPDWTYGFLGVQSEDPKSYLTLAQPGAAISRGCAQSGAGLGSGCLWRPLAQYLQLPIIGRSPMPPDLQWLYKPTGSAGALGGAFWIVADSLYWLFWLNFMVGTFNALPMLPLDGGHMFKSAVLAFLRRRARSTPSVVGEGKPEGVLKRAPALNARAEGESKSAALDFLGVPTDRVERKAQAIAVYTSLLMLFLIVWQIVGPRVGAAFGA